MKAIGFYLVAIAITMTALMAGVSSFAGNIECTFGSHGQVIAEEQGRC